MGSFEALQLYWSSPLPLATLSAHGAILISLALLFLAMPRPGHRLRLLYSVYAVDVSLWSFVAASFLLCIALSEQLEYGATGLKLAASTSVLGGLVTGAFAGAVLSMSRTARAAHLTQLGVNESGTDISRTGPILVFSESPEMLAASSSLYEPIMLISRQAREVLSPEELEAVIAHETAHITHHDSRRRLASAVFSRCMFFDPVSKLVDPAIHRQAELLADERAASTRAKAQALASALVRLESLCGSRPVEEGFRGLFSRRVPLDARLRLLATAAAKL